MNSRPIDPRRILGSSAERAVRAHVVQAGWQVIAQNVRWREGELDLIGLDGRTLVFCEVKALKAHRGAVPFSPFDSIGGRKQSRIRGLASRWLADDLRRLRIENELRFNEIRFDAFAVIIDASDDVRSIEHLESAF